MIRALRPSHVIERLDTWSRPATWIALAVSCIALIAFDQAFPTVGTGPLYIPLIALAGWRLGPREAWGVALAAAALNILPLHGLDPAMTPVMAIVRGMVRFVAYAFVTLTVCGLRRVYDREMHAARHDPLTGSLNRAAFEAHARTALEAQAPDGAVTVLALADIDGFKTVNDVFGHTVGDDVLRRFAAVGASAIRPGDHFGRLGGDEFVILLQARSVADAASRVETLHRRFRDGLDGSDLPVGASLGALIVPPGATPDWAVALREADRLMYLAKRAGAGGSRVATFPAIDVSATPAERVVAID